MSRALILLGFFLLSAPVAGQIYKWVLPDGTVQFSDRPQPEAEEIQLKGVQTYNAPSVPSSSSSTSSALKKDFPGYTEFKVTRPKNDETLRDNGGSVAVQLTLVPGLQPKHTVDILMNGQVLGSGKSLSLTLTNVDRGSHTVTAVVKDENGAEVVRASGATFHLKRAFRRN